MGWLHSVGVGLATQWATLAVVVIGGVAFAAPDAGTSIYDVASPACVCLLFLLQGLGLDMHELHAAALHSVHIHVLLWTFSLVAMPLAYWAATYRWRWDATSGILSVPFADGTMTALCMPTTASTSLIFTQEAEGDASLAALNMAGAQLLGTLVSPAMADSLLIRSRNSSSSPSLDLGAKYVKLSWEVVAPLIGGVCLQLLAARARRASLLPPLPAAVPRIRKALGAAILVFLLWLIFCKAFHHGDAVPVGGAALARLLAWVLVVHVVALALAWITGAAFRLSPPRRITLALVGPQKTEGMAIALIGIIFPSSAQQGEMMLPIVAYHSVQMLVAALVVPKLRNWGQRRRATCGTSGEARPDDASDTSTTPLVEAAAGGTLSAPSAGNKMLSE